MDRNEFVKMFMGDFKVDERQQALDDRLMQYYRETDECSNQYARERWRHFKLWAYGYTQKEISDAKKRCSGRRL